MAADKTKLVFNPLTGKFDSVQDVSGLAETADLVAYQDLSEKGVANGYASLDNGGKVPVSQLPNSVMQYQGQYNATTNVPVLVDGTGDSGDVYEVVVAGSQNFGSGTITFNVGDWVVYNGSVWQKSINSNEVVSVNGLTGAVTLDTDDVAEGSTNLYYTTARFDTRLAAKSTDDLTEGVTNLYYTNARAKAAAVSDAIVDGVTDVAPSQNAVFDALALKADATSLANKADTDLSNLVTTDIPVDLLPDSDSTKAIGSSSLQWANGFIKKLSSAAGAQIDVVLRALQFDGTTVATWFNNGFQIAATKILRFTDDADANTLGLKAPATLAASVDYTLPAAAPTSNGQALISTTSGVMSFASVATNPMTTGGDLIYGGASGAPTRLANGTSGQVLTSAGGTAAPVWKTTTVAARASRNAAQNLAPNNSSVKVNIDTIQNDVTGMVSIANNRINILETGTYSIVGSVGLTGTNVLAVSYIAVILLNGTTVLASGDYGTQAAGASFRRQVFTGPETLTAGDFIELYFFGAGNNSASQLAVDAGRQSTFLGITKV